MLNTFGKAIRDLFMSKPYNRNIRQTLIIVQDMLALAEKGDLERVDASCGILYGVLRDSAYRLRRMAEDEREKHERSGKWD